MRLLFKIDDNSNLKIEKIDVQPEGDVNYTKEKYVIYFEGLPTAETLNELISLWMEKKEAYED